MSAAVSLFAAGNGGSLGVVCFLGKTGEGVEFSQKCDDRFAAAILGDKGSLFSGKIGADGKALLFQILLLKRGGFFLLKPRFGVLPNLIADADKLLFFLLNALCQALSVVQCQRLLLLKISDTIPPSQNRKTAPAIETQGLVGSSLVLLDHSGFLMAVGMKNPDTSL